jgi:hypothetical protein
VVGDGLERSRLTVFFRLLPAIPHLIWLTLWALVAYLAAILNWFAVLITGVSPPVCTAFWPHTCAIRPMSTPICF